MAEPTKLTEEDKENIKERIAERSRELNKLLDKAENPAPGVYEITVAEVLMVGYAPLEAEIAIVKDTDGKIWAVPESHNEEDEDDALISRWDVEEGMRLRLFVVPPIPLKNEVKKAIVLEEGGSL